MRLKTSKGNFLTLRYEHEGSQIGVRVPWPLANGNPRGQQRFCWPFPGQEKAWACGGLIRGVLFIGDEIRGFTVPARYYNDAVGPKDMACAIDPEDVISMVATNRVVQNVGDPDRVQHAFDEVVSLIRKGIKQT
jgi:hypothetical protein